MNTKQLNTQETMIKNIMIKKYGEYKCHIDGYISYKRLGNTRRLKFSKLYKELQGYGVKASSQAAKQVIFKYRSNISRVNVNN